MEQRALLAVALVAGCVTAAGAGGYVAVRQLASPAAAPTEHAAPAEAGGVTPASGESPAPAEGTENEVLPASDAPAVTPAPVPAPRESAPAPARLRPERDAGAPARTAPASRPAVNARRAEPTPQAAPSYRPAPAPPRASDPAPTTTAARHETPRDTLPARETSADPSRDDGWPSRDHDTTAADPLPSRTVASEPSAPPTPVRRLETVTIPADSVIGVQLETTISTESARVEDPVRARVTRDLLAGGEVVVPAGSRLMGNVVLVEEGGRVRERARLGVRFHTLVLADGTEVRLPTETVYRDGESPSGRSAARIGGATVGGAIIGAILGGGKGAAIGAATGAGGGTAVAMAGDRRPAELRAGQPITVRVSDAVTTQVER